MQKSFVTLVVLILLGVGGFFGFQQYQAIQARRAETARVAAVAAQEAAAAAKARAQEAARVAALEAARKDVEEQLRPLKVTSIMLGQPAMAIINKKEYAEGDALPLPKGKTLRVTAVREDGVQLAYNGLAFRLDAPAAPDLDALRKAR